MNKTFILTGLLLTGLLGHATSARAAIPPTDAGSGGVDHDAGEDGGLGPRSGGAGGSSGDTTESDGGCAVVGSPTRPSLPAAAAIVAGALLGGRRVRASRAHGDKLRHQG